jgi:uncharacterized protein (UPF0548 family)
MPLLGSTWMGLSPLEAALGGTYTRADLHVDLTTAGDRALRDIEKLEVQKARIESRLLEAYATLHAIEDQQIAATTAHVSTDRVVTEEIALATGVGTGEVARRLSLATSPRRHRLVLGALRRGEVSLNRALQVASDTAQLSDADVTSVEQAVLAPSRDGQRLPQRTFVTRLRRAVASADQRGMTERRERARMRRGVFGRMTEDGMGCLTLVAPADVVASALDRLDAEAGARRGAGDARSLDQLRCDRAAEALLHGRADHSADATTGASEGGSPDGAVGSVWLVMPFEVATGLSDPACELPGHGWVTAEHAREIMTRPGSVWRTLPVDIRTGRALSRPTRSYRPTHAMVEHVRAVDGVCRGPGCEVVATRCDLDHEVPWPSGETAVGNLYSKHRLHHNVKTQRVWRSEPVPDDGLEWTTLAGRRYITYPKDWREGLPDPDVAAGRDAPADHDPPPF